MKNIRNFSIIAHVDHGKSTLADRFIQECGGLDAREMQAQVLDTMDLERERGITIKAASVTLGYKSLSGEVYQLNFIDTPGHVDFSYEVSRSLAACEGALLVVDAAQGVEAQSVANCYTALEQGLEVLPVINKIDLPSADPAKVIHEIEEIIGIPADDAALVSAKTGLGIPELLEHLVKRIPAAQGRPGRTAAGAHHRFVVRQLCGRRFAGSGHEWCVAVGQQDPGHVDRAQPRRRQAGPVRAQARDLGGRSIRARWDSSSRGSRRSTAHPWATPSRSRPIPPRKPLAGFKQVQPRVFAGLFPVSSDDYEQFRDALKKLKLNDSALHFEPEVSTALGFGFRCGFLGLLAHGHRAGAARARVRPRFDHQRADRDLRGAAHGRLGRQRGQSRPSSRRRTVSPSCASPSSPPTFWSPRTTSAPY